MSATFTVNEIYKIAKYQRYIILAILLNLIISVLAYFVPPLAILSLVISLAILILFILFSNAIKNSVIVTIICAILMFVPIISLILLLIITSRATAILRNAGLKVGLLGVSKQDLLFFAENNNISE